MKHILLTTIAAVVLVGCATPAQSPNPPLFDAVKKGDIEAVRKHLAAGADVNAKDDQGYNLETPLHKAAFWGNTEIIEFLIAKGAEVNVKNKDGKTPLDWAIEYDDETVVLLRKHGGKTGEELKAEGK